MRYLILVLLCLPIAILAFVDILTRYKLKKISKSRFIKQTFSWMIIAILIIGAFPVYNLIMGNSIFFSEGLSFFDIVQNAAIIYMVYSLNAQRRKAEQNEKTIRELHQELSIILSENETRN